MSTHEATSLERSRGAAMKQAQAKVKDREIRRLTASVLDLAMRLAEESGGGAP